jgi:hypothetical protein
MSYIVWVGGIADSPYSSMEAAVRAKTGWEANGYNDVTIQKGQDIETLANSNVFTLVVETGSAAFESEGHDSHIAKSEEIARILTKAAKQLVETPMRSTATIIHDINGNAVGSWHLD